MARTVAPVVPGQAERGALVQPSACMQALDVPVRFDEQLDLPSRD